MSHTIQLRGPWTVHLEPASGLPHAVSIFVRSPGDWLAWLKEETFTGRIVLDRSFKWTFPHPPPANVAVCVSGREPSSVHLNGERLDGERVEPSATRGWFDVTNRLRPTNHLELEFHLRQFSVEDRLIEQVALSLGNGQMRAKSASQSDAATTC